MKSECSSVHKPESIPGLEVQCSLRAGHSGFHQGMGYSWPAENSPLALNPNRPLNPAALRAVFDLASTLFGLIGFILLFTALGLIMISISTLERFQIFHAVIAIALAFIGLVFVFGGYRIWSRSLRI